MEITYDKEADAIYITLREGEFSTNKKADEFTILDLDGDGHILGIELLQVSKRFPGALDEVHVKNLIVAE